MSILDFLKIDSLKKTIEEYENEFKLLEKREKEIIRKYKRKAKKVGKMLFLANPAMRRKRWKEEHKIILFEEQDGKCNICGKTRKIERFEVDHIIPFSLGGKNNLGNTQLLCRDCNRHKSNKVKPNEYNDYLVFEALIDL